MTPMVASYSIHECYSTPGNGVAIYGGDQQGLRKVIG